MAMGDVCQDTKAQLMVYFILCGNQKGIRHSKCHDNADI